MSTFEELAIKLSLDSTDLAGGIEKSIGSLSKGFMDLGNTVNMAVGGAMIGAGVAIGGFLASSVSAAAEAEGMQAQLAAVIKSTGGAAGMTADAVNKLANGFSTMTPFEDDAIVAGENLLLTFTNIGKDVFPATTETMLDMSQALGQDMKSSAMQLGKALNDPVKGVTALQRVGVTFTEEQKKMIEKMVETGDVAGAQKVILAELNKEFGGSAAAAGKTFAGSMEILKNTFGNLQEEIGGKLLPILTPLMQQFAKFATDIIPVVAEKMGGFIEIVGDLVNKFSSWGFDRFFKTFEDGSNILGGFAIDIMKLLGFDVSKGQEEQIYGIFQGIGDAILWLKDFIMNNGEAIKGAFIGIGTVLAAAGIVAAIVGIAAAIMNPITLIIGAAALLGAAWAGNWGGIQEKTAAVIAFILPLVEKLRAGFMLISSAIVSALMPMFERLWGQIQGGLVNVMPLLQAFQQFWTLFAPILSGVIAIIIGEVVGVIGGIANAIQPLAQMIVGILTGIVTTATGILNVLTGIFTGNGQQIQAGLQQVWSGINQIVTSSVTGMINTIGAFLSGFTVTFVAFFSGLGVDVVQIVINMWAAILIPFVNFTTMIIGMIMSWGDNFKNIVNGITTSVVLFFTTMVSSITTVMSGLPGMLITIGAQMMMGLVSGVNSMIANVLGAVSGVASSIVAEIQKLLGVQSPSTVFHGIGQNLGTGLINGINSTMPALMDTMSGVSATISGVGSTSYNQSTNYAFYAPVYFRDPGSVTNGMQGYSF